MGKLAETKGSKLRKSLFLIGGRENHYFLFFFLTLKSVEIHLVGEKTQKKISNFQEN